MSYTYHTTMASTPYTVSTSTSSTSSTYTIDGSNLVNGANIKPATLKVMGNAEFDGDVKIQGKNLKESLEAIEARLAILHPNEELEEKWDQLRGLRQMYLELEAEIIEKEKMWAILKK